MIYSLHSRIIILSMIYFVFSSCESDQIRNVHRTSSNFNKTTVDTPDSSINSPNKDNDMHKNIKEDGDKTTSNIHLSKKDIYKAGFKIKRAHQVAAVKQMLKIEDYSKQYKMVKLVLEKIFQILAIAKLEITQSSYIPGQEFPDNEKERDALAHVIENTAFFGDILLRLPDITHEIYKSNKEWKLLVHWGIGFCNETGLFDGTNEMLLSLIAQELHLIPRDPLYINPYKAEYQMEEIKKKEGLKKREEQKNKKKDKKKSNKKRSKRKKGPRLSHTDL